MEITNKRERRPTEQKKVFANNITNKGLIAKVYKVRQPSIKKKKKIANNLIKKQAEGLNKYFPKNIYR